MNGNAPDTPAWDHIAREIDHRCDADAAMLARALRCIGLVREFTLCRGDIPGWAPDYQRLTPWRARMLATDSKAARGLRSGEWSADAIAAADAQDARDRAAIAERNRALRDAPVFMLSRDSIDGRDTRRDEQAAALAHHADRLRAWFTTPARGRRSKPELPSDGPVMPRPIFLALDGFAWRDHTGAAFGDGLASLAAFVWQVSRGKALARVARVVGVSMVSVRDLDRRIAAHEAVYNVAA
jgi:hypothetical protein